MEKVKRTKTKDPIDPKALENFFASLLGTLLKNALVTNEQLSRFRHFPAVDSALLKGYVVNTEIQREALRKVKRIRPSSLSKEITI